MSRPRLSAKVRMASVEEAAGGPVAARVDPESVTWTLNDHTPIPWRETTSSRLGPFLSVTRIRSESGVKGRPA